MNNGGDTAELILSRVYKKNGFFFYRIKKLFPDKIQDQ